MTSSLAQVSIAFLAESRLSIHLIEQPKTFVFSTGTGLPAKRASMALRVSWDLTRSGFSESSIRPTKRSFRWRSKTKACGVAAGP